MGFDLAQFFGLGKKSPDRSKINKLPLPPKTLPEASPTMGMDLNEWIKRAAAGEGYDPRFVSETTSPVVAQRRARWQEEELPALEGAMSARGLGRSTIAGGEIARASGAKERDIDEIIAQAYLMNEQAKERARQLGITSGLSYAGTEADLALKNLEEQIRREEMGYQTAQARQASDADLNRRILAGMGQAAPGVGSALGAGLSLIPGIGPIVGPMVSGLGEAIGQGIGGMTQQNDMGSLQTLLKFLQSSPFVTS